MQAINKLVCQETHLDTLQNLSRLSLDHLERGIEGARHQRPPDGLTAHRLGRLGNALGVPTGIASKVLTEDVQAGSNGAQLHAPEDIEVGGTGDRLRHYITHHKAHTCKKSRPAVSSRGPIGSKKDHKDAQTHASNENKSNAKRPI